MVKNSPSNEEDRRGVGLIPSSGRYPGGGHGNPLQFSCLENPMDRGVRLQSVGWQRVGHGWSNLAHTHKWYRASMQMVTVGSQSILLKKCLSTSV